jgi:hypothetical protein
LQYREINRLLALASSTSELFDDQGGSTIVQAISSPDTVDVDEQKAHTAVWAKRGKPMFRIGPHHRHG